MVAEHSGSMALAPGEVQSGNESIRFEDPGANNVPV